MEILTIHAGRRMGRKVAEMIRRLPAQKVFVEGPFDAFPPSNVSRSVDEFLREVYPVLRGKRVLFESLEHYTDRELDILAEAYREVERIERRPDPDLLEELEGTLLLIHALRDRVLRRLLKHADVAILGLGHLNLARKPVFVLPGERVYLRPVVRRVLARLRRKEPRVPLEREYYYLVARRKLSGMEDPALREYIASKIAYTVSSPEEAVREALAYQRSGLRSRRGRDRSLHT